MPRDIGDRLLKKVATVFTLFFAISFLHSCTTKEPQHYNADSFSMTLPTGSSTVTVKNNIQPVGKQQMVQHSYSFQNDRVAYNIVSSEYSDHAEKTSEEVSRAIGAKMFDPGFSANMSKSYLGTLPAVTSDIEGTVQGKPAFVKTRMAISEDRKHMWIAIAVVTGRQNFPSAQVDEFMNSIQINSSTTDSAVSKTP